jgi:dihydrofolate synthase/folylpolyglutamate synthase
MTYSEAIQFLQGLQLFGVNLGLENTRKLAALAGNPHEGLRFIHVAGTNGKGSTCAMLESIYRHSGLRVGLFTSPHLVSFAERIQVNRQWIPEPDFAKLVEETQRWLAEFPKEEHPTLFEVVTVMALRWFSEQKCDLVIWETGLGGRLDATNIVTPLASVITNIGFDHQQWLGDTLDKIAAEKAGIIKPSVPVITAATPGRRLEVIAETALRVGAPLIVVGQATRLPQFPTGDSPVGPALPNGPAGESPEGLTQSRSSAPLLLPPLQLPLPGEHQKLNAAVAIATVRALAKQIPIEDSAIQAGLERVEWAGRMQIVEFPDGRTLVLDGAHNPDGAAALRAAFEERFPGVRPTLLLGVLADKDWPAIVGTLAPLAGRIVLAPVSSERSLDPEALRSASAATCPNTSLTVCTTLADALGNTQRDSLVLLAGSLYLVGEALERLGLVPTSSEDERALNEWSASRR